MVTDMGQLRRNILRKSSYYVKVSLAVKDTALIITTQHKINTVYFGWSNSKRLFIERVAKYMAELCQCPSFADVWMLTLCAFTKLELSSEYEMHWNMPPVSCRKLIVSIKSFIYPFTRVYLWSSNVYTLLFHLRVYFGAGTKCIFGDSLEISGFGVLSDLGRSASVRISFPWLKLFGTQTELSLLCSNCSLPS